LKAIDMHQTQFDRQMEANERHNQMQLELLKAKLAQQPKFAADKDQDDLKSNDRYEPKRRQLSQKTKKPQRDEEY